MERVARPTEAGEALTWEAHPFRRARGKGLAILAGILVLAAGLSAFTGSPFWGIFTVFALGLSLEAFYFPTRFLLDEKGISLQKRFSRSTFTWERFRRVYEDRFGLTLSPYRHRSFLEPYGSVRLLFDGGEPERIRARVRGNLPAETEWLDAAGGRKMASGGPTTPDTGPDPVAGGARVAAGGLKVAAAGSQPPAGEGAVGSGEGTC